MTGKGWDALKAGSWQEAKAAFESLSADGGSPAAFDGLGQARWWLSDVAGAIAAWERAYTEYRHQGADAAAARVALFLWTEHGRTLGNHTVAEGWLARARTLVVAVPPSAVHGWMKLAESEAEMDPAASFELAAEALTYGRQLRDPDLELAALGRTGLAEIWLGRVDEGMSRFDEAMAAATAGEPHDLRTVGDLFCALMLAAEITLEMDRFEQWNSAVFAYMRKNNHPDVLTFCGTCCAAVLGAAGEWQAGEKWLVDTLGALQASHQNSRCVHPTTRLASLRVMQGRLEEAEGLLRGYEDLADAKHASGGTSPGPAGPGAACSGRSHGSPADGRQTH